MKKTAELVVQGIICGIVFTAINKALEKQMKRREINTEG